MNEQEFRAFVVDLAKTPQAITVQIRGEKRYPIHGDVTLDHSFPAQQIADGTLKLMDIPLVATVNLKGAVPIESENEDIVLIVNRMRIAQQLRPLPRNIKLVDSHRVGDSILYDLEVRL